MYEAALIGSCSNTYDLAQDLSIYINNVDELDFDVAGSIEKKKIPVGLAFSYDGKNYINIGQEINFSGPEVSSGGYSNKTFNRKKNLKSLKYRLTKKKKNINNISLKKNLKLFRQTLKNNDKKNFKKKKGGMRELKTRTGEIIETPEETIDTHQIRERVNNKYKDACRSQVPYLCGLQTNLAQKNKEQGWCRRNERDCNKISPASKQEGDSFVYSTDHKLYEPFYDQTDPSPPLPAKADPSPPLPAKEDLSSSAPPPASPLSLPESASSPSPANADSLLSSSKPSLPLSPSPVTADLILSTTSSTLSPLSPSMEAPLSAMVTPVDDPQKQLIEESQQKVSKLKQKVQKLKEELNDLIRNTTNPSSETSEDAGAAWGEVNKKVLAIKTLTIDLQRAKLALDILQKNADKGLSIKQQIEPIFESFENKKVLTVYILDRSLIEQRIIYLPIEENKLKSIKEISPTILTKEEIKKMVKEKIYTTKKIEGIEDRISDNNDEIEVQGIDEVISKIKETLRNNNRLISDKKISSNPSTRAEILKLSNDAGDLLKESTKIETVNVGGGRNKRIKKSSKSLIRINKKK